MEKSSNQKTLQTALVYDVEVLRGPKETEGGWKNPAGMGFGTAVVYDYKNDVYLFFGPHQKDELISILTGNLVVSFNGIRFDNSVLLGNDYQKDKGPIRWPDYDILLEVVKAKFKVKTIQEAQMTHGFRAVHDGSINLDAISRGTLGIGKTGSGAHAPELIREEEWAEVYAYNLNDVRLTRKLYDFIKEKGFVIDGAGNQIMIGGE